MTDLWTREQYAAHVGKVFRIDLDENSGIDLTLSEISDVGAQTTRQALEAGRAAPYSLLFRGPAEPVLPQSIYRLSHTELGALELFLVPIGPEGDGMGYEAAFS